MKRTILFLCVVVGLAVRWSAFAIEPVVVRPVDTGVALLNPGMGWVFHHYDNSLAGYGAPLGPSYDGHEFPGLSVVYLRLAWSHLEPEEGKFNWSILDTPIQRYIAAGKRIAFRFTVFEGRPEQGTPEWVRAAGAKGKIVETYGTKSWEPDYDDPVFLAKLERFLMAAGAKYGRSSDLAFVDVGTLGIWGEGHPIARDYGLTTLKRHIELHRRAFPRALLVANDDWATWFHDAGEGNNAALDMARSMGLTFRDDTLCVYADPKAYYSAYLAQPFWPDRPVILEMDHYQSTKTHNTWGDGRRYLQAVEDYHGSYVSVHGDPVRFLEENKDLVARINRRVGYRLNLLEAKWPGTAKVSMGLRIEAVWRNGGVAPCLPGGYPAWSLFNAKGEWCAVLVDEGWNVSDLAPGQLEKTNPLTRIHDFRLPPNLPSGEYELRISVGDADGTPRIALPLPGDDGRRHYALGKIHLE